MTSEQITLSAAVRASNDLTAMWCGNVGHERFVVSGAGLWPLLALLLSAADGRARTELGAAVGRPAQVAQSEAVEIIRTIADADAAAAAIGLWLHPSRRLADADWGRDLPPGTVATMTGQADLDAWADRNTRGLIRTFPLRPAPDDALLLATALGVRTRWRTVFERSTLRPDAGPWRGRVLEGLARTTSDLSEVAILDTGVVRLTVSGAADVDVHVLLGSTEAAPGAVLAAGLSALSDPSRSRPGTDLPIGFETFGLTVREVRGTNDTLAVTLPPFDIRSSHDVCAVPEQFGLAAATDPGGGQFPALGRDLFVSRGAQGVLATFSWKGFEAAAVTTFAMQVAGLMYQPTQPTRRITLTLDRPFGFVAVHRPSGLALVAGWVGEPSTATA